MHNEDINKKRGLRMKFKTAIQVFLIILIIYFPITLKASTYYPLQTKYPNIMLYKADTNKKIIALTFDDGPDNKFTPQILNILKKHNVKATFFFLGTRVHQYPDTAKKVLEDGHVIGNHTYWHPELTKTGVQNMEWEIKKNEQEIQNVLDIKTNLFRAPYGALTEKHVQKLDELGYYGIGWSIDTEDWRSLSAKEIKQNVINRLHPGAIVLMHSAGHWTQDLSGTAEALDEIIPLLKQKGYTFVTIPEMISGDILK